MIPVNKRKISVCILLSIVTFRIYQIYWGYLLVKNTRAIQNDKSSCIGEMLCLMFVPFYSLYWWFSRGKMVKDRFAERGCSAIGNEIAYLLLGLFGFEITDGETVKKYNSKGLLTHYESGSTVVDIKW